MGSESSLKRAMNSKEDSDGGSHRRPFYYKETSDNTESDEEQDLLPANFIEPRSPTLVAPTQSCKPALSTLTALRGDEWNESESQYWPASSQIAFSKYEQPQSAFKGFILDESGELKMRDDAEINYSMMASRQEEEDKRAEQEGLKGADMHLKMPQGKPRQSPLKSGSLPWLSNSRYPLNRAVDAAPKDTLFKYLFLSCTALMAFIGLLVTLIYSDVRDGILKSPTLYRVLMESGKAFISVAAFSLTVSAVLILLMQSFTEPIVYGLVGLVPASCGVATIWAVSEFFHNDPGSSVGHVYLYFVALTGFISLLASSYFIYSHKETIQKTTILAKTAADVLASNPSIFFASLLIMLAYLLFLVVWTIMFAHLLLLGHVETIGKLKEWRLSSWSYVLQAYFLFMLIWTTSVFSNIQKAMLSGTVSTWYFHHDDAAYTSEQSPAIESLQDALSIYFGQICLGSLIITCVRAMRFSFQAYRKLTARVQSRWANAGLATVNSVVSFVERLVEHVTEFAIYYTALSGDSFCKSGRNAVRLFKRNALLGMTTDLLAQIIFSATTLAVAILTGLTSYTFASHALKSQYAWASGLLFGLLSWYILQLFADIYSDTLDITFLCYAIDLDTEKFEKVTGKEKSEVNCVRTCPGFAAAALNQFRMMVTVEDGMPNKRARIEEEAILNQDEQKPLSTLEEIKKLFRMDEVKDSTGSTGFFIEMDKYFPFPFSSELELNPNFLWLFSKEVCGNSHCAFCKDSPEFAQAELEPRVKFSFNGIKDASDIWKECVKDVVFAGLHEKDQLLAQFKADVAKKIKEMPGALNRPANHFPRYLTKPDGIHRLPEADEIEVSTVACLGVKGSPTALIECSGSWGKNFNLGGALYKFYFDAGSIHVYLDISPEHYKKIPKHVDQHVLETLQRRFFAGGLFSPETKGSSTERPLSDTADFPEAIVPAGFKLTLRDYQLRSLSWMRAVEAVNCSDDGHVVNNYMSSDGVPVKLKLGHSSWHVDVVGKVVTSDPRTIKDKHLRIKGGILADDTGSGKTITCLALVHSAPFTDEHARDRRNNLLVCLPYRIPSRATCVICPSNLYKQWVDEAKRCMPHLNILGLSWINDHKKLSWREVMFCDLLIVSYQFLTNASYLARLKELGTTLPLMDVRDHMEEKGRVDLRKIQFYRLMFDEMHEMDHKSEKCKEMASKMSADYHWGITGTPKFSTKEEIRDLLPYLNISERIIPLFEKNWLAKDEFLSKFIKRNVPNLKLPPLTHEVVWVDATAIELALMNVMSNQHDKQTQIMMCSHYQIANQITGIVGESFLTIEHVKTLLGQSKLEEMITKESQLKVAEEELADLKANNPGPDSTAEERARHKDKVERRTIHVKFAAQEFATAKSTYIFFVNTFRALEQPADNECLICRDNIALEELSMLPCSHLYCYTCLLAAMESKKICPFCRFPIENRSKIMRLQFIPETVETAEKLNERGIDTSKYGSKLVALYNYINDLIESDPNARIILFLQYKNLSDFISSTLNELSIKHVRVSGNVFKRQSAITQFTTSPNVRLIMLSSEDSVSGINLTQATHVVLLHPFWTGQGEQVDMAWEKQGICRAYRSGLDHPIKVIRFAVRGTIEEELTNLRHA